MAPILEIFDSRRKAVSDQRTTKWASRLQEFESVTEDQIRAIAANAEFVERRVVPFCKALSENDTEAAMRIFNSSPYPHQVVFTRWLAGDLNIAPVRQPFIERHDQA